MFRSRRYKELERRCHAAETRAAEALTELERERASKAQWFAHELRNLFLFLPDTDLARKRLTTLAALMVPHEASGVGKIRLGRNNDGGYVCLDDFNDIAAAFSLGISDDVSWDTDVANKGVSVFQYDHTVTAPPVSHPRFCFHQTRIGTRDDGGDTLVDVTAAAGVRAQASAILKIDIEHAEWGVFDHTSAEDLSLFAQIVGEFHGFDEVLDDGWYERAHRVFSKIGQQFRLIHVHGNNYASQIVLGSKLFPRCLELTFANMSRYTLRPSNETFPGVYDTPNNPQKPDCGLDHFRFA